MDGSELKELFCKIFAQASVSKALTSHAYARAFREHFMIYAALVIITISYTNITEGSLKVLNEVINKAARRK